MIKIHVVAAWCVVLGVGRARGRTMYMISAIAMHILLTYLVLICKCTIARIVRTYLLMRL